MRTWSDCAASRQPLGVGDDNRALVLPVSQLGEDVDDALSCVLVEVPGGFVGEEDVDVAGQRACYCDALLLAAGESQDIAGGHVLVQAHPFQELQGVGPAAAAPRLRTGDFHGGGDVLQSRHIREQVVVLEDRGGVLVPVAAEAELRQILAHEADGALGGRVRWPG